VVGRSTVSPPPIDPGLVVEQVEQVRQVIAAQSADPSSVRLVAVTKGFGPEAVRAAVGAGVTDIGENYADELVAKAGTAAAESLPVRWHFLGSIQRNKVARLAPVVAWWQGVARIEEGRSIAARSPGATVLVQVDVAGLPGRGGCRPEEVPHLVEQLREENLEVAGLMTVGPPGSPEAARPGFRVVSALADRLHLPERSMGMSDDYPVALTEGSTMVRIGRRLFGDRPLRG
jgi:pyridoxal phosphate enzyme (YggS family)